MNRVPQPARTATTCPSLNGALNRVARRQRWPSLAEVSEDRRHRRPPDTPIRSSGVLRVGTEGTYSPFSYHDQTTGQLTGYDGVNVARRSVKLGVKVEFNRDAVGFHLRRAGGEAIRRGGQRSHHQPERQAKYDLSQPYSVGEEVIVTRADDDSIWIARPQGEPPRSRAPATGPRWPGRGRQRGAVEGFAQAITLLNQGRIDATVNDSIAVYAYLARPVTKSFESRPRRARRASRAWPPRDSGYLRTPTARSTNCARRRHAGRDLAALHRADATGAAGLWKLNRVARVRRRLPFGRTAAGAGQPGRAKAAITATITHDHRLRGRAGMRWRWRCPDFPRMWC